MIKLRLLPPVQDLPAVQQLPGLQDLVLDPEFGLVCLSPHESLFAVRTDSVLSDLERRRGLSPEILGAYGDVRISPT
jgi:hypothetical protein